jgi:hypothetical protein
MDKRKVQVSIPITLQVQADVGGSEFLSARFVLDERHHSVVVPEGRSVEECVQGAINDAVTSGSNEVGVVSSVMRDVDVTIEVEIAKQDDELSATFSIDGTDYGVELGSEDLKGDGVQDRVQEYFDVLTNPDLSTLLEDDEDQDGVGDDDPDGPICDGCDGCCGQDPQSSPIDLEYKEHELQERSLTLQHEAHRLDVDTQIQANQQNFELAKYQNDIESDKVSRTHEANCAEALCHMLSLLHGDQGHDHDEERPEFPIYDDNGDQATTDGDSISQLVIDTKGEVLKAISRWVQRNVPYGEE